MLLSCISKEFVRMFKDHMCTPIFDIKLDSQRYGNESQRKRME